MPVGSVTVIGGAVESWSWPAWSWPAWSWPWSCSPAVEPPEKNSLILSMRDMGGSLQSEWGSDPTRDSRPPPGPRRAAALIVSTRRYDLRAVALPPLRPAAFFCAVVPPWLESPPEPDFLPPRLEAPGEFAIFAARSFDMPLSFRASYCFSFLTFADLLGIENLLLRDLLDGLAGQRVVTCLRDVGLGEDPDELSVLLAHGQAPNLVLRHQSRRLLEALLRIDRDDVLRGDLGDGRLAGLTLGEHADREVAVGDHADE